jgi:hypothetical protein
MVQTSEDTLRTLIRMIPAARTLRDDLEKSLMMDTYQGTGNAALSTCKGLLDCVATITGDEYIKNLVTVAPPETPEKDKVAIARLTAGQILAYLEGQTGLPSQMGGGESSIKIQKAPNINMGSIHGMTSEAIGEMMGMMLGRKEKENAENAEESTEE